jgi:hypothetical protein
MARGLYSGGEDREAGPARGFEEFQGATCKSPAWSGVCGARRDYGGLQGPACESLSACGQWLVILLVPMAGGPAG